MIQIAKNTKKGVNASDDLKLSWALMASFVILTVQFFILTYFDLIGTSSASIIQLTSKFLVGIAFVYAFPVVLKRSRNKLLLIYFISTFIFLVNYLIFTENQAYLENLIFPFFFMSLPAFVFSLSIKNIDIFKQVMRKSGMIVFVVGSILGILIFSGRVTVNEYSMALSYYMLLPALIFLDELFDKFSLRLFLFELTSLMVILALGSRGAILCIVVFIFLKIIRIELKFTALRMIYYSFVFGTITLIIINLEKLFELLYYYLLMDFGIKSRSLMLFLRGDVHLSGRDNLYNNAIHLITENPILGNGIAGDRRINGGAFVHNFFLEVLINFGVIVGSLVIIILIYKLLKSLLQKNKVIYNILIMWISLGMVPLMVSSSYITDLEFWILLGMVLNIKGLKSQKKVDLDTTNKFRNLHNETRLNFNDSER